MPSVPFDDFFPDGLIGLAPTTTKEDSFIEALYAGGLISEKVYSVRLAGWTEWSVESLI